MYIKYENVICITKDGRKIKLREIEDNHLINRIKYFKKTLNDMPSEHYYIGNSDIAEDAVNSENAQNEALGKNIKTHIKLMEEEAKKRKIRYV